MSEKIILGTFDGIHMIGDDSKIYQVPTNYASKSRLVEGDGLKLKVEPNGNYIYKQIAMVPRKRISGIINSSYQVFAENKIYNILNSSKTFFKLQPGDVVSVFVPIAENSTWAAMDKLINSKDQDKEL